MLYDQQKENELLQLRQNVLFTRNEENKQMVASLDDEYKYDAQIQELED